ncbi:MAG: hypothetical protein PHE49_04045 [bacterium]|nr:hypothetical protein [bacterium]
MKDKIFKNGLIIFLFFIIILLGCKLNNPFTPPSAKGPIIQRPIGDTLHPGKKLSFLWKYINKQELYCLQISKSINFSSFLIDTIATETGSFYNCPLIFSDTAKYYWRVKVQTKTYHRWSNWSDIGWFLISLTGNRTPIKPHNPFPDSSAIDVSINGLALTWDSGDPDKDTVFYTVYFDTSSSFTSPDTIIKDSSCFTSTTVSYELPYNLDIATTYYWKVSARDNFNKISVGDLWFFTTENTPGNAPNTPGTPNISTSLCYVDEPVIATATTADPDNDSILYMFDYGDGSPTHWTQPIASGQTVVDTHIYNIPFHCYGYFYIKVKAKDKGGRRSDWSDSIQVPVKIREGAIFVCFQKEVGLIIHISAKGTFLDSIGHQQCSALDPLTLAVDQRPGNSPGGDLWVASSSNQQVYRFDNHLKDVLFNRAYSIPKAANPSTPCVDKDGNCWFAFAWWGKIVKLSPAGDILKTIDVPIPENFPDSAVQHWMLAIAFDESRNRLWTVEFSYRFPEGVQSGRVFLCDTDTLIKASSTYDFCGSYLDIDSTTGDCWVANSGYNNVIRVSANCDTIEKFAGFNGPASLSIDNTRRKVWVSDAYNHRIVIINFGGGTQVIDEYNLGNPSGIKVYSTDGSCWAVDADNCTVIKFNPSGDTLFTRSLKQWIGQPAGVAVDYFDRE